MSNLKRSTCSNNPDIMVQFAFLALGHHAQIGKLKAFFSMQVEAGRHSNSIVTDLTLKCGDHVEFIVLIEIPAVCCQRSPTEN